MNGMRRIMLAALPAPAMLVGLALLAPTAGAATPTPPPSATAVRSTAMEMFLPT
jgi:hypothetical protein